MQPNITQKIILRYKNKILITRLKNGEYDFPGGRLEWKESLFESLQRELKEELGLKLIHEPLLFHVWNYISKDRSRHSVMIYYFYELKQPQDLFSPEDVKLLWLNKKEMGKVVRDQDFVERMFRLKDKKAPYSIFYCD